MTGRVGWGLILMAGRIAFFGGGRASIFACLFLMTLMYWVLDGPLAPSAYLVIKRVVKSQLGCGANSHSATGDSAIPQREDGRDRRSV